ncbi:unnamed protein product [Effrenium voratum]|nr:unnamed protein product [Effrenium voratum]
MLALQQKAALANEKQLCRPASAAIVVSNLCLQVLWDALGIEGTGSQYIDLESRASIFASEFYSYYVPSYVYFVCALPFAWFCIRKLEHHKLMMDQMAHFDLRNAKCKEEADRKLIEEQVVQLFDEALDAPLEVCFCDIPPSKTEHCTNDKRPLVSPEDLRDFRHITSYPTPDQIVDQFNSYVRGPLCDLVEVAVGKEQHVSAKLCLVGMIPLLLSALVTVLSCDGRSDCQTSADYAGLQSVSQYMTTNAVMNLVFMPLVTMLGLPLMLRANSLTTSYIEGSWLRMLVGSVLSGLVLKTTDVLLYMQRGMMLVVVTRFSAWWLVGLTASVLLELVLWSRLRSHGTPPVGRYGHTLSLSEDDAVVFGGWCGATSQAPSVTFALKDKVLAEDGTQKKEPEDSCDYCMTLRTADMQWVRNQYAGAAPSRRYGHSATAIGPHLIIFGGWDGGKPLNDVIVLRDRSVAERKEELFESQPEGHFEGPEEDFDMETGE